MEDVKLMLNGRSAGSISLDSEGKINKVFIDSTSIEEDPNIIESNLLGTKVDSEDYYHYSL